jgi:hypothetical protein
VIHKNIISNQRKTIGKPYENQRKTIGKPEENQQNFRMSFMSAKIQ